MTRLLRSAFVFPASLLALVACATGTSSEMTALEKDSPAEAVDAGKTSSKANNSPTSAASSNKPATEDAGADTSKPSPSEPKPDAATSVTPEEQPAEQPTQTCSPKLTMRTPACTTCAGGSCCESMNGFADDPKYTTFTTCLGKCASTDTTCMNACSTASPTAAAKLDTFGTCIDQSCATECAAASSGGACTPKLTFADAACSTCAGSKCCESLNAYAAEPEFADYDACNADCTSGDTFCYDLCDFLFPSAADAFTTFVNCASTSCPTECGG